MFTFVCVCSDSQSSHIYVEQETSLSFLESTQLCKWGPGDLGSSSPMQLLRSRGIWGGKFLVLVSCVEVIVELWKVHLLFISLASKGFDCTRLECLSCAHAIPRMLGSNVCVLHGCHSFVYVSMCDDMCACLCTACMCLFLYMCVGVCM